MKNGSIFENSESRALLRFFTVSAALFLTFSVLLGFVFTYKIEHSFALREESVAGYLLSGDAGSRNGIVWAFTKNFDPEKAEIGASALEKEGYSAQNVSFVMPFAHRDILLMCIIFIALAAAFAFAFGGACVFQLKKIYGEIDMTGELAQTISRGKMRGRMDDTGEGAFARMRHKFNEMSASIQTEFEKLEHDRLFLKNLISDISHQLKTPLSALKMYNEIILSEPLTQTSKDFSEKSCGQLYRMEWLILGLLKMARIETGALELNIGEHRLSPIINSALSDFRLNLQRKDIALSFSMDENLELRCDAKWLKEAVGNVIKNCIEYTPRGGKISIGTSATPIMNSITIRDSGPGIHPDDLPYIFRRFYRGRGSHSSGSGIGLSLSKSITEQMGGTLSAGGTYGQGAVFCFSFPKTVI